MFTGVIISKIVLSYLELSNSSKRENLIFLFFVRVMRTFGHWSGFRVVKDIVFELIKPSNAHHIISREQNDHLNSLMCLILFTNTRINWIPQEKASKIEEKKIKVSTLIIADNDVPIGVKTIFAIDWDISNSWYTTVLYRAFTEIVWAIDTYK